MILLKICLTTHCVDFISDMFSSCGCNDIAPTHVLFLHQLDDRIIVVPISFIREVLLHIMGSLCVIVLKFTKKM